MNQTVRFAAETARFGRAAAIVVTWNPERDLQRKVGNLLLQVEELYLIDNGSTVNIDLIEGLRTCSRVLVRRNDVNLGVATALNQGMAMAQDREADWVLLLDQDSLITPGYRAAAERAFHDYPNSREVAIIAPLRRDQVTGEIELTAPNAKNEALLDWTITSGSFVSVRHARQLGPYMNELFSDYVDLEYCLRARAHGYVILQASDALLHHTVGKPTRHAFLGWRCQTTNHNAWRRYYIARNRLWLYRMYFRVFPKWVARDAYALLREIAKIALFEQYALEKLRYIARGLRDGVATSPLRFCEPVEPTNSKRRAAS